MKNLKITVNGVAYDVQVEETNGAAVPAAPAAAPAPAPAAAPKAAPAAPKAEAPKAAAPAAGAEAVSYTHLDVYKRQVGGLSKCCGEREEGSSTNSRKLFWHCFS